jgi:hypothetical protein
VFLTKTSVPCMNLSKKKVVHNIKSSHWHHIYRSCTSWMVYIQNTSAYYLLVGEL